MDGVLDFISENENFWGFLALLLAAGIEYVFPPFPGDTVVLLAGVLVAARGWSVVFVLASITLGSVIGAMLDYYAGDWIRRHPDSRIARWLRGDGRRQKVAKALASMRRYGPVYLTINRFLPGIRAFFFVGAGMARLNAWQVAFWGGLSALLWNALILFAGWVVGGKLAALQSLFETYTAAMWSLLGVAALAWLLVGWARRRRSRRLKQKTTIEAQGYVSDEGPGVDGASVTDAEDSEEAVYNHMGESSERGAEPVDGSADELSDDIAG